MVNNENSYRWWENYLVRYFMPSIAGVAILGWFISVGGDDLKKILFFGNNRNSTLILTLLILYGNLFCYIASYPILTFHATRVIDFPKASWDYRLLDGYISSLILAFATGITVYIPDILALIPCSTNIILGYIPSIQLILAFVVVISFSYIQLKRAKKALNEQKVKGLEKQPSSLAYGYTYALSRQRGIQEETVARKSNTGNQEIGRSSEKSERKKYWRREIMDTYKHLREHGNSAFIFCLELVLAALCHIVFSTAGSTAAEKLSWVGVLLGIWALPAISTHLLGQVFERRFSKFDRRIDENRHV